MNIDPNSTIAGKAALEVRELLRRGFGNGITWWDDDPSERKALLDRLASDGLLTLGVVDLPNHNVRYELTDAGRTLAKASARKPFKRATAQRALDGFLARVEEVNADELCTSRVTRVVLIGSMLDPARERVSDVDLLVRLERKRDLTHEELTAATMRWTYNQRPGPGETLVNEEILWRLQAGSPVLSVMPNHDDEWWKRTPYRVIWSV